MVGKPCITRKMDDLENEERIIENQINRNNPGGEEVSLHEDQQITEQTKSLVGDGSTIGRPQYELDSSQVEKNTEVLKTSLGDGHRVSRVSHPEEESYSIPHSATVNPAPRMIQKSGTGKSGIQNAFKRLRTMGSVEKSEKLPDLLSPGDFKLQVGPADVTQADGRNKTGPDTLQRARLMFKLTSRGGAILALLSLPMIAVVFMLPVTTALAVDTLLCLIIDWINTWVLREYQPPSAKQANRKRGALSATNNGSEMPILSNTPGPVANTACIASGDDPNGGYLFGVPKVRQYDGPRFIASVVLIVLYTIMGILIPVSFVACSAFGMLGMAVGGVYGGIVTVFFTARVSMFVQSGITFRLPKIKGKEPVPAVAVNQLDQVLPAIGNHGNASGEPKKPTWLMGLSRGADLKHPLTLIKPMPAQYINV